MSKYMKVTHATVFPMFHIRNLKTYSRQFLALVLSLTFLTGGPSSDLWNQPSRPSSDQANFPNRAGQAATKKEITSAPPAVTTAPSEPDRAAQKRLGAVYGKLPLHFEANHGQAESQVKFLSRGRGYSLALTSTEAVLALNKAAEEPAIVRMKLADSNADAQVSGLEQLPG